MKQYATSGSPYEAQIGFSRAVRSGNVVMVSGTAPIAEGGGVAAPGDAYGQAKRCLEIIHTTLKKMGVPIEHVVRTRTYLTRVQDWEAVGKAHGELFAKVRPASTMVVVKELLDPAWLVEIEAEVIIETP